MSDDEIKYGNSDEPDMKRREGPEEKGMDDRAAEFVFQIFSDQNAKGNLSPAIRQWTEFLSLCKTVWSLSQAGDAENPDPAVQIEKAGMIHTGMGICTQTIWLDVQEEYTVERGEYLTRFSGRDHNPFFGTDPEHPTLLVSPIPSGDDPLSEILKMADDRMFSFRWLDGTCFQAIPCADRDGALLICDLKHMDRINLEKTNAALIEARESTQKI